MWGCGVCGDLLLGVCGVVAFVGCFILCGVGGYACDLRVVVCCFYVSVLVRLVWFVVLWLYCCFWVGVAVIVADFVLYGFAFGWRYRLGLAVGGFAACL